ncbi:hypothetical protein OUZ56_026836 [Daphnia magna]|uniref:Uncharacterized protein n=1 Tax=Daphnia magna TaxID=35525 RepID=A0ABQ9ZMZ2_9CRUS|nr:hypothetical protein OUZ56_026836 [Daphnia magna]
MQLGTVATGLHDDVEGLPGNLPPLTRKISTLLEWLVLGASQRECKSFFLLNSTSRCASSNDKIVIASLALPVGRRRLECVQRSDL